MNTSKAKWIPEALYAALILYITIFFKNFGFGENSQGAFLGSSSWILERYSSQYSVVLAAWDFIGSVF